DQLLPAEAVRQRSGRDLQNAPHHRVDRLDEADAGDAKTIAGEKEGIETPGHAVVEIVHEARLTGREEAHVPEARDVKDVAERWPDTTRCLGHRSRFEVRVGTRLSHEQNGD